MTLAAAGAFAAYAGVGDSPATSYAVVDGAREEGTRLGRDNVRFVPMELADEVAAGAFVAIDELAGRRLLTPLLDGDLIQLSAVSSPSASPEPAYEVPVATAPDSALAGRIEVGDRVDVYATFDAGVTDLVVAHAEVIETPSGADGSLTDGLAEVVVLRVADVDDVPALVHAGHAGSVTLVRSTFAPRDAAAPATYRPAHEG
jgi:Flp pilus assembly protein CpaB